MKYIRIYETEEKFLADKDSTSRGFRLKPTLYKYSDVDNGIYLELDDPRKHEGSTYMEITLDSDTEFSFYICNKSGDTQTTMTCTIDWGDGTVETKTITEETIYNYTKGFKLSHNYKVGNYKIELYGVERVYSIVGKGTTGSSVISPVRSVKRVILDGEITGIGEYAFSWCNSLTSVYISKGVTSIEYAAFSGCSSLTSVHISESVTSIGKFAFSGCSSLKSITIPNSVTIIDVSAFQSCSSLKSITIPNSATIIGSSAFAYCTSLTSVHIPNSVTNIYQKAFTKCTSLTSINIPERVTSIGDRVFYDCSSLKSISSLNTTAPTLGSSVFKNLPTNGTLHIKPGATGYNKWLKSLPSGWTIVEDL